jgi:hypothetical protein
MRRAHERPVSLIICNVQNFNDGAQALKSEFLGSRFFFGHVVDAKELVIAK